MNTRKRLQRTAALAAVVAVSIGFAACGSDDDSGSDGTSAPAATDAAEPAATDAPSGTTAEAPADGEAITVGFVAVGPEGAWRAANEANMQDTFTAENGFDLKYAPATNLDQKSQIDAFTSFVDEGVDVILLSATEGAGWEDSLTRAQEAEIPVILIDRGIEPDDPSLYVTRIAPDNVEVARASQSGQSRPSPTAATTSCSKVPPASASSTSATTAGTTSWTRSPEFVKIGAQTANWSAEEGKSVFETVLKANDNDIQLVFAQNDEMGLGAALAVEEAGLVPGEDVHDRHDRRHEGRHGGPGGRTAQLRRRVQPAVRRHRRRRRAWRRSPASRSSRTSSCRAARSTLRRPPRRRCPTRQY